MANVKITDLTNYTDPETTDVMPIVDVVNDTTKKVSVGEVVGKITGDVDVATDGTSSITAGAIVDADVNANAEIAVSKLADGTARQLLQTDAAGTGVEWTDNVDVPGTLDVTGATTLDSTLTVPLGSAAAPTLRFSGDANTGIYSPGADQVAISTNANERARIDSSGRLLVGTSTALSSVGFTSNLQVQASSAGNAAVSIINTSNDAFGGGLITYKAKGTSVLQENDGLAQFRFAGYDGSTYIEGARISAFVDGTPGANDMPGRLVFSTSADGASSPTERMRIDSAGFVSLGGDTNTGFSNPSADTIAVSTGGSERARIDSSGRLLVGTSTARTNFYNGANSAQIQLEGTNYQNAAFAIVCNANSNDKGGLILAKNRGTSIGSNTIVQVDDDLGSVDFQGSDGAEFVSAASIKAEVDGTPGTNDMPGRLVFSTTADGASSPTERMRITQAGSIWIGQTTTNAPGVGNTTTGSAFNAGYALSVSRNGALSFTLNRNTTDGSVAAFYRDGVNVGTIAVTTTATAYNTSSDYRLKENVVPLAGAVNRLNQLQVHRFNFIADPDKTVDGFIAHEAQAVVPECVTGTKDEVDDEGNPVYQGIDQSKIVPLVVAALQEALAEIETLKTRLADAGIS